MSCGHAIAIAALPTEPLPYGSANDFPSWGAHIFVYLVFFVLFIALPILRNNWEVA